MFSKSFVRGARVGKFIARSGQAVVAGTREVGGAFRWIGGEVKKDSKRVASSVTEFGRGVKAGFSLVEG